MFKYSKRNVLSKMSFSCKESIKDCKWRFIIMLVISILSLCIGVFLAIRVNNAGEIENIGDYGFAGFSLTSTSSLSTFFTRLLSLVIFSIFLMLFSLSPILYTLAGVVIAYRSYLVGLNITVIIICNGLAGIFTTIFIIFPCQLVLMILLACFFAMYSKQCVYKRKTGQGEKLKVMLIFLGLILLVDIVESLLLLVFSSPVILVV